MMSELKREYENVKRKKFHYSHYKVNDQFIDLMADFNEEFRTTGFKISKPVRKSLRCLTERTLLKKFAPAAVVVDELGNILFIHGRTGMFLELRPGSLGISNVLKMSRVGMRRELRLALKEAITHQKIVYTPGLSIQAFGEHLLVNLTVGPLENYTQEPALYIIIFENGTKGQSQRSANVDERYPINFDEKKNIQVDKDEYKDVLKIERMIISKSKELSEIENELKTNKKMFEMSQRELQNLGEMVDNAKNDIEMNEKLEFNKSELGHSDQLLKAANKELQIVNEKLALGQSELDNNDRRLEKGKEELEILNEKFTFIKSELINKSQLLESAKDEFKNVKEKVASCKNELRINNNLLENLKNEIESVRIELDSVRVELKKENGLPELLKQKLESIKSELKLLKIELKETNNELYSANNQLQRTNEEIEDSKLLLNSMKKELATTLSKIRENRFNDKVLTLFNDEEPTNDKQYTLFSNKGDAIENVHSLFNNQEAVIEDSQTRNIEDKPLLTKSKNNDNSIKLPGINTIQFHFRDKYENEPSQINDGDRKIDNAEVESSQLDQLIKVNS